MPCHKLCLFSLFLFVACQTQVPKPIITPSANLPGSSPPASATPVPTPTPDFKLNNLIPNPGAEAALGSKPADWDSDSYGDLRAELTWRGDDPFSGQKYLSTQVSQFGEEGDAKWFFTPVALKGKQWYEYRDQYRSDGRSRQLYSCKDNQGKRRFFNASQTHTSPGWHESVFRFYLPHDCDVTVLHSLDRNGFLHTDHHQLRQVTAAPLNESLISISFDDIWKTAYSRGLPELEKRGMKGSFYITRLYTENPADKYANRDDILDLIKKQHEVGSHSHRHTALSTMENPDLLEDIRKTRGLLSEMGISQSGIAYPFGDFNDKVEIEVQRYHDYARTSLAGLNDKTTSRYRLRIIPVTTDTTTEELKMWIQAAAESKSWLILLFHGLGTPEERNPYITSFEQYVDVLNDIQAKKLKVVTVEQGLKEAGL